MADEEKKKVGRPKKNPQVDEVINEEQVEKLEMSKKEVTLDDLSGRWSNAMSIITKLADYKYKLKKDQKDTTGTTMAKWNSLNPFLQNQRIKNLFTQPGTYSKEQLSKFLIDPQNYEKQLRASAWTNSSSQQIYYTMLRRACDVPVYNYFVIPEILEKESDYNSPEFKAENNLVEDWLELLNIPNSFKTMALQIKREGKQSYILRNKIIGEGKNKKPQFAAFEKLPTDWIKITGIGQLGFTISFNMMYFMKLGNNPEFFGEFMVKAWNDIINKGVVELDEHKKPKSFDMNKAKDYSFNYEGETLTSMIEGVSGKDSSDNFMFWLKMPFDMCFTFGTDNSHAWVAPDTMGALVKLQELTDYGTLAGLIASTPLTAILTGEAEFIEGARAGKNETKISPEVLKGLQEEFNYSTSTNVEAMFFPLKNIKLQQLAADVNSSEIISNATENFVETVGEGGLSITTNKPNVSQIKTAQLLAASQQRYVTLQFENALNYILKHKLGFKHVWKVKVWGDIFSLEGEKKYLKELAAAGNIAVMPKLMSAEGISMRDTKAICSYIKSLDFYKEFQTYSQQKAADLGAKQQTDSGDQNNKTGNVGRPGLDDDEVENDATAKSKEDGTNTRDNRDTLSHEEGVCPICGAVLEDGQIVCEECAERIKEQYEEQE